MKKIFFLITICSLLLLPVLVLAAGLGDASANLGDVVGGSGLQSDLPATLGMVIKATLSLVGTIFLILTVYAGILWMIASGHEEQIEKATGIIKASIIGLFIVMSAYAITYFVTNKLGAGSTGSSGSTCCCVTTGTAKSCKTLSASELTNCVSKYKGALTAKDACK